MTPAQTTWDVAIVGLGPVGLTLAGLLGHSGLRVVALDQTLEPTPYPRAIAADDEMVRTVLNLPGLSAAGHLFEPGGRVDVRDGRGRRLTSVSFPASPFGVPGLSFFHQPSLERELRAALAGVPGVRLEWGARVTGLRDEPGGVRVHWQAGGAAASALASWVVGCDGAASLVRQARGIGYEGRTFGEPWIVIDVDTPAPLAHLPGFSYLLDRRRPSVNMPRPGGHRFEFMVRDGEDPAVLADSAQIDRWLEPYLAPLDPTFRGQLRVVRAAAYSYHARVAGRWRDGRVLLAGDAAHCMPPFGGQGLGAGIGDALALAWRLGEVQRGIAPPRALDGYERERKPRLAQMTRTSLIAGRMLTARTVPGAGAARLALRAIDAAPVLGRRFRAGSLRPPPRLTAPAGERRLRAGEPLANPLVRTADGLTQRLDTVLPAGWLLLGRAADPWHGLPLELATPLRQRGCHGLSIHPPATLPTATRSACPAVEDLDGSVLELWRGRQQPGALVLVRPDRFLVGVGIGQVLAGPFRRVTDIASWLEPAGNSPPEPAALRD